jgi:hypothetical protein
VRAARFREAPAAHRARLDALGGRVEAGLVHGLALRHDQRTPTPAALMEELKAGVTPPRRYGEPEVQEIVRRATELEASRPDSGVAMTIGGIEALGVEVGLAPELVREAAQSLSALGPAPRELTGDAATRFHDVAYSAWQLMDPTTPPGEGWGATDVLSVIFFSIVTAGVLPLVFISLSRARKRRLRAFFREGVPAAAEVIDFREEDVGFQVKLTRVRYEFEADGRIRRGSDLTLPVIADRWRAGERIEILYRPNRDYDSMIATSR